MTIDMGLDDPEAMEALTRAIRIVDESVDSLREDIGAIRYCDDSEVCRLAHALPSGPLSLDHSIVVAAEAARGALDQISWTVRNHAPTSMIVLHALLRAALVGSARVVFVLLPSDPSVRLQNARVLLAQEGRSFAQALDSYAKFDRLASLRPDEEYLKTAREQNAAIQEGPGPPGDGAIMQRAVETVATALTTVTEHTDEDRKLLREHVTWMWNTYSGVAHTYAWPRLLPGSGQDRRVPGDFPGDFYMIATITHIAMVALKSRLQPGSASTTTPVPLT